MSALTPDQVSEIVAVGREHGLDSVGTCTARAWTSTRSNLVARREAGLSSNMEFTYRNPARSTEPTRILRRVNSLFVGVRSYAQTATAEEPSNDVGSRVARYASADHYGRLEVGLAAMARQLVALGFRAAVIDDKNDLVDREAAWRAGLGSYGKNSLLLVPGAGSWFVIGSVVTDAVVPTIPSPVADSCGVCTKCITGCPTGAIVQPGVVDAGRCLAWLLQAPGTFPVEHREALGNRIYGCDECQEVCPPNATAELRTRRSGPWPTESDPGTVVGTCDLHECYDNELLRRCARWYIPKRDVSVVRRNLLIILGNSTPTDDGPVAARAIALIEKYVAESDPVLAETAQWAATRRQSRRDDLARGVRSDEDGLS